MHIFLALSLLVTLLIGSHPTSGFQPSPDLVVHLRDQSGVGVAGAQVRLRDVVGEQAIATETTDATGTAIFAAIPIAAVRVQVRGAFRDGTALKQIGQDAEGVAFVLGTATTLDLRVEPDGIVLPDPATMIPPDVGVPLDTVSETATAQASTQATQMPVVPATPTSSAAYDGSVDSEATRQWFGWLLLVLGCALTSLSVLLVIGRGRS